MFVAISQPARTTHTSATRTIFTHTHARAHVHTRALSPPSSLSLSCSRALAYTTTITHHTPHTTTHTQTHTPHTHTHTHTHTTHHTHTTTTTTTTHHNHQGCMVGCDTCDGTNNHFMHGGQSFLYNGMQQHEIAKLPVSTLVTMDPWSPPPGTMYMDPKSRPAQAVKPNCDSPTSVPTMCGSSLRTMNVNAECGGPDDIYFYSPCKN